jgi:hypothetical protein
MQYRIGEHHWMRYWLQRSRGVLAYWQLDIRGYGMTAAGGSLRTGSNGSLENQP